MTVLDELAEEARRRVRRAEREVPLEEMRRRAEEAVGRGFPFEDALRKEGMSFICEVKKASPSKGVISESFPYMEIARDYERGGASCISVLTEPSRFLGDLRYLSEIAGEAKVPVLRKDFVVDEYMIYEAKLAGASAVLLICSILGEDELSRFIGACDSLGMSALVEAHDEEEVSKALRCGARVIGVNNRDLRDFTVDHRNCLRLRPMVPGAGLFVAESGIRTRQDIEDLERSGVDAVLIGETLMRAEDRVSKLRELKGSGVKVKLCGMRTERDVSEAVKAGADMIGMVLSPGFRRSVPTGRAVRMSRLVPRGVVLVGVFVDSPAEEVEKVSKLLNLGMVQLHGSEDDEYVSRIRSSLGVPVVKSFVVKSEDDLARAERSAADLVLLDGGMGSGEGFDRSLMRPLGRKVVLAGGLTPENVGEAVAAMRPYAVDVSSGIETDGAKDPDKMKAFVESAKAAFKEDRK